MLFSSNRQVQRRAVALVMSELLRLLDITGLRPQVLVGKDIHTDLLSQVGTSFCYPIQTHAATERDLSRLRNGHVQPHHCHQMG